MGQNDIILFFFTGLCSHLENKGVLVNSEFADHLLALLEDDRLPLTESQRKELKPLIGLFLPIRAVK